MIIQNGIPTVVACFNPEWSLIHIRSQVMLLPLAHAALKRSPIQELTKTNVSAEQTFFILAVFCMYKRLQWYPQTEDLLKVQHFRSPKHTVSPASFLSARFSFIIVEFSELNSTV
jgi:hypothetical protein